MAERSTGGWTLTTWALATVDITLFVLLGVLVAHASGGLDDLLAGLNTAVGVGAFLGLWAVFVLAVRWVLGPVSLAETSLRRLARRAATAGAGAGVTVLLALAALVVVPLVVTETADFPPALLFIVLAGLAAGVVGAVIGLLFGALDVALYRLAGYVLPPSPDEPSVATATGPDRP